MNLDDLEFGPPKAPLPSSARAPAKDAEVIEEDIEGVCARCEVAGSASTPEGTCNVCGATWEDDDTDEFTTALELLQSCELLFDKLLNNPKVVKKLSWPLEQEARALALAVSDFVETYELATDDERGG